MDADALDDLTKLDVDADVRRQLAPTYADIDATKRQQLASLIESDGTAASNAADLQPSGVRAALDYACNSPCSIQLDFSSPMWRVSDDARSTLETRLTTQQYAQLADSDIEPGALAGLGDELSSSRVKAVDDVRSTDRGTVVEVTVDGRDADIDVTARFYLDGDAQVRDSLQQRSDVVQQRLEAHGEGQLYDEYGVDAIKHLDEIGSVDKARTIRGEIAEDAVLPDFMDRKYGTGSYDASTGEFSEGYIPKDDIPVTMDGSDQGFDGLVVDDGDLVVVEGKATSHDGRITQSKPELGDTTSGKQLSESWIREKFSVMMEGDQDARDFVNDLEDSGFIDTTQSPDGDIEVSLQNVRTNHVVYQDAQPSGELASPTLNVATQDEPSIDAVDVLKIGDVFQIE